MRTSVGMACFPRDGRDPEHLLKRADLALYAAKAAGRNCVRADAELLPSRPHVTKP